MNRLIAVVRALMRVKLARRGAALLVRTTGVLADLARRLAKLDPDLACEVGLRATCTVELDPPAPPPREDLDALPSETTGAERRFLYSFFAHNWSGDANVVEVGPFIGGTTRAIALGMLANPRRNPDVRLYTYDRFGGYYEPDALAEYLDPLFASGLLGKREREAVTQAGRFGDAFDAIHRDTAYGELVVARDRPLPDMPEEAKEDDLFDLDPDIEVDAVFVDGCKSWYATKYFMRRVLDAARPGSHVIFQDYGWYTCFWIPAFVHAMGDAMTLTARVDTTYAFHFTKPVSGAVVDEHYPDRPEGLGRAWFDEAFTIMNASAQARGDLSGAVVLRLQHAGALAYLGERDEARELIERVRREVAPWGPHQYMIAQARESPTYRPGGEPILL